jgi:hypothetical protein
MERIDRIVKLNGEIKPEEDGLPSEVLILNSQTVPSVL